MSNPSRREFLHACATLAGSAMLAGGGGCQSGGTVGRRPNVVVIVADDLGEGDLPCLGNPFLKTPNIDRLYAESTRLTRFHVSPVCSPTRASLMTGRYNYRTGVTDVGSGHAMMHPDEVTIAEMLSAAGYATGIFGKWHLGDCFPTRANDNGFQESLVFRGGGLGQDYDFPGSGGYYDPLLVRNGKHEKHMGYCTDVFAQEAVFFMSRYKDRPFFLYLPFNAPHTPTVVDAVYAEPYRKQGIDEETARFYGMIAKIDENIGLVLGAIDSLGLRDNTIVLFTSDNGAQMEDGVARFDAGLRGAKSSVYEGGIRVPCFARWPGRFAAGKDIDRLAAHIDVVPTLLDFCGVPHPRGVAIDGTTLAPLLRGEVAELPERTLFIQYHAGNIPEPYTNCCAMTQQFKLVNGVELYDLTADPAEKHDIAADHPDVVRRLRAEYETWFDDVCNTREPGPPEIVVGDERCPAVYLSWQDRLTAAGPPSQSEFWKVRFARAGVYDLTVRFSEEVPGGSAVVKIGGVLASALIDAPADAVLIPGIRLPDGPASIRAWAPRQTHPGPARALDIVYVGA